MKSSDLLVFTTTFNEVENIGPLLDQIVDFLPSADILVVDDNSPDGTWQIIQEKALQYQNVRFIKRPGKLGIGSAHKYALIYAMNHGYNTLITMDADFSHEPKYLPSLLKAHDENVFVTGSRYCEGGSLDYDGYRRIVSLLGNFAARLALGVKIRELTTYFRVFDVNSLRKLALRQVSASGYSYGVQLISCLNRAGVELREVPIHSRDRAHGVSKIPKLQIFISAIDICKLALRRFGLGGDVSPDQFVYDKCRACDDRALAMTLKKRKISIDGSYSPKGPDDRATASRKVTRLVPVYVCLRCMEEQLPPSICKSNTKTASESPLENRLIQ